jgi:probable F420-dependent oxidoreductase
MLAHQVASLDWLSNGRFLFGIGAGWLEEEMALFTSHFPYRFGFMREAVAAMRKLWSEDGASFHGKWIHFPAAVCRPKPVQKPHPPVLLGGMGPNAIKRVATWGDGWLPIGVPPDSIREARGDIDRQARAAGRDPSAITITAMLGSPPGMETPMLEAIPGRDVVQAFRDAGANRIVVSIPTLRQADAYRHLDAVAAARLT